MGVSTKDMSANIAKPSIT